MPKAPKLNYELLWSEARVLLRSGPSKAKSLAQRLGISQSALSRLLQSHQEQLVICGKAQKVQYALRREIMGLAQELPLYRIDSNAKCSEEGKLIPIFPEGFFWQSKQEKERKFFPDLPYFLEDARPAGFLGRLVPRLHPELGPKDIQQWKTNHALVYLANFACDLIGNFILGEQAFHLYLEKKHTKETGITPKNRSTHYKAIADDILKLGDPGSSAAGEQPKFLATKSAQQKVLVKFSPKNENPLAARRSDLLWCEYLATKVLAKYKFPVTSSTILEADNRTFLEIVRFDRNTKGGRLGLISLRALDLEYAGIGESWTAVARALEKQKKISSKTLSQIEWLDIFGELIANNDRHLGNLSFYFEQGKVQGLAPVYDMLPMLYYSRDEIVTRKFAPPLPTPAAARHWHTAHPAALDFWKAVSTQKKISAKFRAIAKENIQILEKLKVYLASMPST